MWISLYRNRRIANSLLNSSNCKSPSNQVQILTRMDWVCWIRWAAIWTMISCWWDRQVNLFDKRSTNQWIFRKWRNLKFISHIITFQISSSRKSHSWQGRVKGNRLLLIYCWRSRWIRRNEGEEQNRKRNKNEPKKKKGLHHLCSCLVLKSF